MIKVYTIVTSPYVRTPTAALPCLALIRCRIWPAIYLFKCGEEVVLE